MNVEKTGYYNLKRLVVIKLAIIVMFHSLNLLKLMKQEVALIAKKNSEPIITLMEINAIKKRIYLHLLIRNMAKIIGHIQ